MRRPRLKGLIVALKLAKEIEARTIEVPGTAPVMTQAVPAVPLDPSSEADFNLVQLRVGKRSLKPCDPPARRVLARLRTASWRTS